MAKGLMIHDQFGELAVNYYTRFPDEVVDRSISIIVEQPVRVNRTSLSELLKAIIQAWTSKKFAGSDLLLVTHGNERGLTMRLFPGHRTDARSDCLDVLMSNQSERDKAQQLYLTPAQVGELVGLMNQVRNLKINSVEFRGCNIGLQKRNVNVLKDFFNANWRVTAPDVLSVYGYANPDVARDSAQMDRWIQRLGQSAWVFTLNAGRFAFQYYQHSNRIIFLVENLEVLPEWIKRYIYPHAPDKFEGWMRRQLPLHFFVTPDPYFPQEGSYVQHLVSTN